MAGEKLVGAALRKLNALGLYSKGAEAAAALKQAKGTPEQMRAMLLKQGVKPAELENAKFNEAFAGRPSVTKDEIAKLLQERAPRIEESVLGGKASLAEGNKILTRDELRAYKNAPEGTNIPYEYYLLGPNGQTIAAGNSYEGLVRTGSANRPKFQQYTLPGGENYRELRMMLPDDYVDELAKRSGSTAPNATDYRSSHWDEPNVLAHLRMADRTGPGGEKMLHIEEIQSDWGQAGRKQGFGYNPGEQRELEKKLEQMALERNAFRRSGSASDLARAEEIQREISTISAYQKTRTPEGVPTAPYVTSTPAWTDLALKRALREAAEGDYHAMAWTPGAEQAKRYPGTGEAGMVGYYDKIIPTQLQKLTRDLDPNAQLGSVPIGEVKAPSLTITPDMREKIKQGLPLFAVPAAVGLGAAQQEEGREGFAEGGPAEAEYSLVDDVLARIRDGRMTGGPDYRPTQDFTADMPQYDAGRAFRAPQPTMRIGDMMGIRTAPNFNIPPDAYTEARNAKFPERAGPLNLQPPAQPVVQRALEAVRAEPRPVTISRPRPAPAPARRAPAPDQTEARRLWAIYNESGNPADFVRANNAMRAGREDGGSVDAALNMLRGHYATDGYVDPMGNLMAPGDEGEFTGGERFQRALENYRKFPTQEGEAVARPYDQTGREKIGQFIAGDTGERDSAGRLRSNVARALVGNPGLEGSGMGFGLLDAPMATGIPLMLADMVDSARKGNYGEAALGAALPAAFYARKPLMEAGRRAAQYAPQAGAVAATGAVMSPQEAEAGKIQSALNLIRAYHGSPHKFDRFDMSKIGTGEGAQAYGHGLYFAESEPVARGYRDQLSSGTYVTPSNQIFDPYKQLEHLNVRVASQKGLDNAIDRAFGLLQTQPENKDLITRDLKKLMTAKEAGAVPASGHMYEVNINADPARFLDWDKPLRDQPTSLREAVEAINSRIPSYVERIGPESTGNQIEQIARWATPDSTAKGSAAALRSAGIPGIRYLDAGSRNAGEGSRNYVVFDDQLVDINRRYNHGGSVSHRALMVASRYT